MELGSLFIYLHEYLGPDPLVPNIPKLNVVIKKFIFTKGFPIAQL
jgi:hypothetical protein